MKEKKIIVTIAKAGNLWVSGGTIMPRAEDRRSVESGHLPDARQLDAFFLTCEGEKNLPASCNNEIEITSTGKRLACLCSL
jgi:hypothetical protein